MLRPLFAISILLCLMNGTGAFAQDQTDLDTLTRAEAEARQQEKALAAQRTAIRSEINGLKAQLQDQSQQTQAYEREGLRLQGQVDELSERIDELSRQLSDNRRSAQDLLAALQRLERAPSAALSATPDNAVKSAQSARLIQTLSSALQLRADEIARLSGELSASRETAQVRQVELTANQQEILRRRERTSALVTAKEALQNRIETDQSAARSEADRLAAEATTLRELLESLKEKASRVIPRLKPPQGSGRNPSAPLTLPPGTAPFADAKGALMKPVAGTLSKAFGRGERGQTYAAPSEGQVVAPYAGRVEFSGPFKTYGRVVILNMDDGYFMLLTGLGQTFVETNETVARGEPIGSMPARTGQAPLYLELRRNGSTINPAPWFP